MDYLNDLFATFQGDNVRIVAVYERVRKLSECIKNISICIPKTNESLMSLERLEGE